MDSELEKAIEEIGRDKVFSRAREIGWRDDAPPKWVWWGIVTELRSQQRPVLDSGRQITPNQAGS